MDTGSPRWRQVEELFGAARECDAEARKALLARAEPDIRREVESLLAQAQAAHCSQWHLSASGWIRWAMRGLLPGTSLPPDIGSSASQGAARWVRCIALTTCDWARRLH